MYVYYITNPVYVQNAANEWMNYWTILLNLYMYRMQQMNGWIIELYY